MRVGKSEVFAIIIITISSVMLIPILGQVPQCGDDTVLNSQTGQCVPKCGEGTTEKNGMCIERADTLFDENVAELDLIVYGVVIGAIATIFGILWTVWERRHTNKKEDVELIQQYGTQLSEIMSGESSLETRIDCVLYTERYLDTLEQIASLYRKGALRKNVADYFENHFAYGRNLWNWYAKNVLKFPDDLAKKEWELADKDSRDDRWREFRWWCNDGYGKKIEEFKTMRAKVLSFEKDKIKDEKEKNHYEELLKFIEKYPDGDDDNAIKYLDAHNVSKKKIHELIKEYSREKHYRVLPDVMEDAFDDIPEENGLSKDELIKMIQQFSSEINKITNNEKTLKYKIDCSLYAEQYLDTLEQIASLYRKTIIPKRAADYFENKFAYGVNLYDWYQKNVRKDYRHFDPNAPPAEDEENDKQERWADFKWFCRGAGNPKNVITKFSERDDEDNELEQLRVLPDKMYEFDTLKEDDAK